VHPVAKAIVGSKMDDTSFDRLDELYHHAKFGEDHEMRAGCRCKNVVFVFFVYVGLFMVTLSVRSTMRSRGA